MIAYLPPLIEKLEELHRIIQNLPTYRFYASSLLVIYDEKSGNVDLKMIDFSHSLGNADVLKPIDEKKNEDGKWIHVPNPPKNPGEPDLGYLMGLETLTREFRGIFEELKEFRGVDGHVKKRDIPNRVRAGIEFV